MVEKAGESTVMQVWIFGLYYWDGKVCVHHGFLPKGRPFTFIADVEMVEATEEGVRDAIHRAIAWSVARFDEEPCTPDSGESVASAFGFKGGIKEMGKHCAYLQVRSHNDGIGRVTFMKKAPRGWAGIGEVITGVDPLTLSQLSLAWFRDGIMAT